MRAFRVEPRPHGAFAHDSQCRVPGGAQVAGQVDGTAGDDGAVVAGQRERGLQRVVRLGGLGDGGITELLARFGRVPAGGTGTAGN